MLDILDNNYFLKFVPEQIYIAPTFDSPYRKPSNKVAKEIKRKFDIEEKNILYIGDTIADYQTAKQSNCKCIIYRGYASKPYKESINIEERYLVYNDLELLEKVKDFINEKGNSIIRNYVNYG